MLSLLLDFHNVSIIFIYVFFVSRCLKMFIMESGFTKLHMGLVVLVKKMSVLINFIVKYQSCVSP
jgi:hypothetical protein